MSTIRRPSEQRGVRGIWLLTTLVAVASIFGAALYVGKELLLLALVFGSGAALFILKEPIYGLYLSFLLIPLEAVGRIVPTNSTWTWAKLVLFLTLIGLILNLLLRRDSLKLPRAVLSLYFVLLSSLLGTMLWTGLGNPVWGVVAFIGQVMVVILAVNLITERRQFENAIIAIMVGGTLVTVIGILDITTKTSFLGTTSSQIYAAADPGLFRVTATFYDPNMLGRYLGFAMVMTLSSMRFERLKRFVPVLAVLLAAQGFVLLNTFSRGSALSLAATLGLMVLWDRQISRKVGLVGAAALGAAAVLIFAEPMVSALGERLTGGGKNLAVDVSRVLIYQLGIKAFWLSPLVGYGPDNVPDAIGRFYIFKLSPHSLYLEVLLASGILGAITFGWFVLKHLADGVSFRSSAVTDYARPAVLALVFVLLSGLTLHAFKANELWCSLALLACLPRLAEGEATAS